MISDQPSVVEVYEARGASAILHRWLQGEEIPPKECMIVGPAGTGKSLGIAKFLWGFCDRWPMTKVLILRKTRVALNDSFLDTFETEVLGPGHPAIGDRTREHRTRYIHENGSEIVLGGLDMPRRTFSTQYHIIFVNEMTELTEEEWQTLHRALRRPGGPGWHLLLGDANPDAEFHWAHKRFPDPMPHNLRRLAANGRERILSWHKDNPACTPAYLDRLSSLVGHTRDRLYLGLWRTASGSVYEDFSQFIHLQNGRYIWMRDTFGRVIRGEPVVLQLSDIGFEVDLTWFGASLDFGWTSPGCLQVWGHDSEYRSYRVAEVYRTKKDVDWWATWAGDLWAKWRFRYLVCDNDEEKVKRINDHLNARGVPRIAVPIEKPRHKEVMFNAVREALKPRPTDGYPGLFLIRNALIGGRDPDLSELLKPCCTEEEIGGLVLRNPRQTERGPVIFEESDPACADHGCDAMGYEQLHAWRKDLSRKPSQTIRPVQATHEMLKENAYSLSRKERYARRNRRRL